MNEVKSINSTRVDQQTIDTLKELLKRAESGALRSVIFIDKYHDGAVGHGWSGEPDREMIGELENLKFIFFAQAHAADEEE